MKMKNEEGSSARRRVKLPKNLSGFEQLLMEMVVNRTGAEFDVFLIPQVKTCAQCWMMLNKVHEDLMNARSLTDIVEGSKGQQKEEVNPLLAYYLKLQAELRLQFQSLGLNWNATPSKITETTKKGIGEEDPMAEFYRGCQ